MQYNVARNLLNTLRCPLPDWALWPTPVACLLLTSLIAANRPGERRRFSEMLGMEAAKYYIRNKLRKSIPDNDFLIFEGRDVFNMVYIDPTTGKVYIVEAKGGKSQVGDRLGPHGDRIFQGSFPYLEVVTDRMKESMHKDEAERIRRKKAGESVSNALQAEHYEYIGIRGDYDLSTDPPHVKDPKVIFNL